MKLLEIAQIEVIQIEDSQSLLNIRIKVSSPSLVAIVMWYLQETGTLRDPWTVQLFFFLHFFNQIFVCFFLSHKSIQWEENEDKQIYKERKVCNLPIRLDKKISSLYWRKYEKINNFIFLLWFFSFSHEIVTIDIQHEGDINFFVLRREEKMMRKYWVSSIFMI